MSEKPFLRIHAVATLLGMREAQVRSLVRARQIPCTVFPNGEIRFDEDEVRTWASTFRQSPLPASAGSDRMQRNVAAR